MATKLGKVVTHYEQLPLIKSYYTSVMQSNGIKWQAGDQVTMCYQMWQASKRDFYSQNCMTLWSSGLAGTCDKLKPLYLHYHNTYEHQTW